MKNLPANAGDAGSIPGLGGSPGEGNGNRLQDSCLGNRMDRLLCPCDFPGKNPGKSHGQRSLSGHSPWGPKRVRHHSVIKQQQRILVGGFLARVSVWWWFGGAALARVRRMLWSQEQQGCRVMVDTCCCVGTVGSGAGLSPQQRCLGEEGSF